ncbi:hypothetical protein NEOLEDRAFT_1137338 [Neolentinus lepideus HHB14362 ss-1]|uniref:Uncharacterized protein n=1 Tax=Neolentinus lepideus HHB14362 ss-1 TaxID=1314782 RepID=A0A165QWD7_9AGAM|nr:hypothetical protein NEOLEDRAFT_1137338 [Neolentinus lepideus HHB14362 ss-1]
MEVCPPTLSTLPTELLLQILDLSLCCHPIPSSILCLNYPIYVLAFPILYEHVRFHSTRGMSEFALFDGDDLIAIEKDRLRIPVRISTVSVEKVNEYGVFDALKGVFERTVGWLRAMDTWKRAHELEYAMRSLAPEKGNEKGQRDTIQQVSLDELSLCLHSHTRNPRLEAVYEALALVNPTKFTWTGPDPDHHFSTAIVPQATFHLFQALRHWSHLTHLKITNIAFPNFAFSNIVFAHPSMLVHQNAVNTPSRLLPVGSPLPRELQSIYIGQATFVPAELIARIACSSFLDEHEKDVKVGGGLHEIRLVDVYVESIWERRMRRGDVERAGVELLRGWWQDVAGEREGDAEYEEKMRKCEMEVVKRIRGVVRCEAKTERIMGGDRVERVGTLE